MTDAVIKSRAGKRPIDGKAIASVSLAIASALIVQVWVIASVIAIAAISLALASRRSLQADPALRGTTLNLSGFLIAVGVLVVTVGPYLLSLFLYTVASARA